MNSLVIRNVRKTVGANEILKGIDLRINDGEFVILVGPSGCGKSTLLNLIAGLDEPTAGEIYLGDKLLNPLSPRDRDIAMVFQSYALYPNMTARQNILFGLEMRKIPKAERDRIMQEVAHTLRIEALLDRKPSQLSGGQRQRVAMGRAIARKPSLFLFDEPLSNLDAKLRVEMRLEIKTLHQRLHTTTVYVTHDQIEAMTLGDRIAIMQAGAIQQFGTAQDIYDNPANLFVAGFIGSPAMNIIPVTIVEDERGVGVELRNENKSFAIYAEREQQTLRALKGKDVVMGVRPEQITGRTAQTHNALSAKVELVEPTGPDTIVIIRLNGTPVACRLHPAKARPIGETIDLAIDMSKAVFFDPTDGKRLA